jgi:DNA-binding PadR family transcriptional regulator
MRDPKPRPNDELYLSILRSLTPEQKLKKVFELNEMGRELLRAGLRQRNPGCTEDEIDKLVAETELKCHNRNY